MEIWLDLGQNLGLFTHIKNHSLGTFPSII